MRLLTKENHRKDVEIHDEDDDDPPIHSFYITDQEYGDNKDSYVQVSKKMIKIYDKSMKLRLSFEGLNIRQCEDVDQSYMYTVSDAIERPYLIRDVESDYEPNKA